MTSDESTALITFNQEQKQLIHNTVAKGCSDTEFGLLLYMASKLGLDPLTKQIWAVKYGDAPALLFVGRDGYLQIAHRSGQFDGMESGSLYDDKGILSGAMATVYRKDMSHPITVRVKFGEYNRSGKARGTKENNWDIMPETMITKVAESQALRKAFAISGVYSPEEIDATIPIIDVTPPDTDQSKDKKWKKKAPEVWPKKETIIEA